MDITCVVESVHGRGEMGIVGDVWKMRLRVHAIVA